MNAPLPLDVLADARRRGVDWMDVAHAFDQLQAGTMSIPSGTTPIRWAEKLSGYSANHLRRMSAGRHFYLELTQANPALADALGLPRFSHLEMLAKIWRLDRTKVIELLEHRPKLSYAGLTSLFDEMQSQAPGQKGAGKRMQGEFRDFCTGSLVKRPDPILTMGSGTYTLIASRAHSDPYCKPDLMLKCVYEAKDTLWAGIDCFVAENAGDGAFRRKIVTLIAESTFLTQHWLCVPDDPEIVPHIREMADELKLANLGIMAPIEGALVAVRMPSGPPVPDRRHLWRPPRLWHVLLEIPEL